MQDAESNLPVARIEPRDAADRMVLVRAEAARRAGQVGRFGLVAAKVAGFVGVLGIVAMIGGSFDRSRTRYDVKLDIKLPELQHRLDLDWSSILKDSAHPKIEPSNVEIAPAPPVKLEKPRPKKTPRVKRQPRP